MTKHDDNMDFATLCSAIAFAIGLVIGLIFGFECGRRGHEINKPVMEKQQ